MPLPLNGYITTSLHPIYKPALNKTGFINNIRISNTADEDYTFELYQYDGKTKISTLLYSYSLLAGKMLNDDTDYEIRSGNYISGKASSTTVTFLINGHELEGYDPST